MLTKYSKTYDTRRKESPAAGQTQRRTQAELTHVVRVEEKPLKAKRKADTGPTEHFNVYLPVDLASDLRMHKARTRVSIQDAVAEAMRDYLLKHEALTVK